MRIGSSRPRSGPNLSLPFFAYGFLKEGEIAYPRIERFVQVAPTPAMIRGNFGFGTACCSWTWTVAADR